MAARITIVFLLALVAATHPSASAAPVPPGAVPSSPTAAVPAAAAAPTAQPTPNAQQLCEQLTRQLLKVQGAQEYQCSIAQQQAGGVAQ